MRTYSRFGWLAVSLILPAFLLLLCRPPTVQSITRPPSPHHQRYLITLHDTANLKDDLPTAPLAKRTALVQRLQETAQQSQAPLLEWLQQKQAEGAIASYTPLWIVNAIAVVGDAPTIEQLAHHPAVAAVQVDLEQRWLTPPPTPFQAWEERMMTVTLPALWGIDRIQAPQAWHLLNTRGAGVTVGIMDTGVDVTHPDLLINYRGYSGGSLQHAGNWLDAIAGNPTPIDPHGHGTHVTGSAVGQHGIGVAPQAQWIATRIFDENGITYESVIHQAFQWFLAPNGNPALAPNIINGSWGSPANTNAYVADVTILQSAGILPVFSAGNTGPLPETINSPASYLPSLGVGASDPRDQVAWFSSRGAGPFTSQARPQLVAPGTSILSTASGGGYEIRHGTSMASPYVAGTAALILSQQPTLTPAQLTDILTRTVTPIADDAPNFASGWGRLDAYRAVAEVATVSHIQGVVTGHGLPLPHTTITLTTATGVALPLQTDALGQYDAPLVAGNYTLTTHPFGYAPYHVAITVGTATTTHNITLVPLASGGVTGMVQTMPATAPLPNVTIAVLNTPITTSSDALGQFTLNLPVGIYTITASLTGYSFGQSVVRVTDGGMTPLLFRLESIPSILLLDSGGWYYESYIPLVEQALHDANLTYDLATIHDPILGVPDLAQLTPYDVVVWSAPLDSPGYVNAGHVVEAYLAQGGKLLISGKDVGRHDNLGNDVEAWYARDLGASYIREAFPPYHIEGITDTNFAGMMFSLNGVDSAGNQDYPDIVRVDNKGRAEPILQYRSGESAGIHSGFCQPYDIVYYAFGLEGVTGANQRRTLIEQGFDRLYMPTRDYGVTFDAAPLTDLAPALATLTYTLNLRNQSEIITDTFALHIESESWHTTLFSNTVAVGPCQAEVVTMTVQVPANLPPNTPHVITVTATSQNNAGTVAHMHLYHKTPGHVLLVDDDRFYHRESHYQTALETLGITYDLWETGWDNEVKGSPSLALLQAYDFVIWYTGYDWASPIRANELATLEAYVAQGGRLFLSSQDYLYYHDNHLFTRDYLGVAEWTEGITPTQIFAGNHTLFQTDQDLTYAPYRNYGDGIWPTSEASIHFWHNGGWPGGIMNASQEWRTVFWGIPWETLPPEAQTESLNQIMGWLSDLGESTFTVNEQVAPISTTRLYTLTIQSQDLGWSQWVSVTNPLPSELALNAGTLTGGATYDPATRTITWSGLVPSNHAHIIQYEATILDTAATTIVNSAHIVYEQQKRYGHRLPFTQTVVTYIAKPDFSPSSLQITPHIATPRDPITVRVHLENIGTSSPVSMTAYLPAISTLLTDSLTSTYGAPSLQNNQIQWQGIITTSQSTTITFVLLPLRTIVPQNLPLIVSLDYAQENTAIIWQPLVIYPFKQYLSFIAKEG